jgi:hypothetical protein
VINPFRLILCLFGYVKIPTEVVLLSITQENLIKNLIGRSDKYHEDILSSLKIQLKGQSVLTKFLRAGRLLNDD